MTLRIKGATTIKGQTNVGLGPVASQNFLTNQTVPSWLNVSGMTSANSLNRMVYDSTGKLTYAPNNLLLQSNTFSSASWTKQNATITTGVADPFGGTAASTYTATASGFVYQIPSGNSSTSYVNSIWIRSRAGSTTITLRSPNAAPHAVTITSSWAQYTYASVGDTTGPWILVGLSNTGDAVDIYGATVSAVTYETTPRALDQVITTSAAYYGPRFDNPNAVAAGLLIEDQRINAAQYSNLFSAGPWVSQGTGAVTAAAGISPDGTNNAWASKGTAGTNTYQGQYQASLFSSGPGAFSMYAKAGAATWFALDIFDGTRHTAWFNLSTGVVGTTIGSSTATITAVGNGWYRCSVSATLAVNNSSPAYFCSDADNSTTRTSTGATDVYIYGAQAEAGSFPTSYIIVPGATPVTRTADLVRISGFTWSAPGTFIMQYVSYGFVSSSFLLDWYAGPGAGAAPEWTLNNNSLGTGYMDIGRAMHANITATVSLNTPFRNGTSWSTAGVSNCLNGATPVTAAGNFTASPATVVQLGGLNGYNSGHGWIQGLSLYSWRIPDAALQAKSVVNGFY